MEFISDLRHTAWMTVSTAVNIILGFTCGILLVRGLDQNEYGIVSSAMALVLVTQELVGKGINDSLVRFGSEAASGSIDRSTEVFRAGLAIKLLFSLAALLIFMGIPETTVRWFGYPELKEAFPAITLSIAGFGVWTFLLTWHQAMMDFKRLAFYQPVKNVLNVLMLLFVIGFFRLEWALAIWILALSYLVGALIFGLSIWKRLILHPWSVKVFSLTFKDILKYSVWNLIAGFAFVAYNRMDIFVLSQLSARSSVATYNASWQILTLIDFGTITVMTVMIPKVCHCIHYQEFIDWGKRTLGLSLVGAVLSLPVLLAAEWYLPLLYGQAYDSSIPLIRIMYWGNLVALLVYPFVGILHARKAFRIIAAIQVLLLIISIPLYYFSTKHYGITGTAYATLGIRLANCTMLVFAIAHHILKPTQELVNRIGADVNQTGPGIPGKCQ